MGCECRFNFCTLDSIAPASACQSPCLMCCSLEFLERTDWKLSRWKTNLLALFVLDFGDVVGSLKPACLPFALFSFTVLCSAWLSHGESVPVPLLPKRNHLPFDVAATCIVFSANASCVSWSI